MGGCVPTLTSCHMDEHALARADVTEVVEHHVGGEVVDGQGGRLLEAHTGRHREDVLPGHGHVLAPHAEVIHNHHAVPDLQTETFLINDHTERILA